MNARTLERLSSSFEIGLILGVKLGGFSVLEEGRGSVGGLNFDLEL